MGFTPAELPQTYWPLPGGSQLQVEGVFFSNEILLLVEAAVHGLGIAFVPAISLGPLLDSGALVQVLPGLLEIESRVAIVYPEREFTPPQLRAFVDTVVAHGPKLLSELAQLKRRGRV